MPAGYTPASAAAGASRKAHARPPRRTSRRGRKAPDAQYTPPPVGYQPAPGGTPPNNYLVQAILVTIFCCLPFGIVGIVFAAQVNSKAAAGDYAGALDSSKKAKQWTTWGFIAGLVSIGLIIILQVAGIALIGAGSQVD